MMDVDRANVTPDAFRDMVDEPRVAQNWHHIESKRKRKQLSYRRRHWIFAVAVVLIGTGILASSYLFLKAIAAPAPLSFQVSESIRRFDVSSESPQAKRIPLSDGSTITLAPGASLEVMENGQNRFVTSLYNGWARYDVVPDRDRTWEVNTGLCRVVVLGTQFTVSRTSSTVRVAVHRGTVAVYAPAEDRILETLRQGETYTLRFPQRGEPTPILAQPRIAHHAQKPSPLSDAPEVSPIGVRAQRPSNTMRNTSSPPSSSTSSAGLGASGAVNRLLKEANDARDRNQPQEAVTLLQRVLREYPRDPSVGLATLTLAKIRLDTLHQPRAAALLFKKAALSRGLPSSLREQAYGRCVEAFQRAGDVASARKMSGLYRRRFPDGAWLPWIERWTESE